MMCEMRHHAMTPCNDASDGVKCLVDGVKYSIKRPLATTGCEEGTQIATTS